MFEVCWVSALNVFNREMIFRLSDLLVVPFVCRRFPGFPFWKLCGYSTVLVVNIDHCLQDFRK